MTLHLLQEYISVWEVLSNTGPRDRDLGRDWGYNPMEMVGQRLVHGKLCVYHAIMGKTRSESAGLVWKTWAPEKHKFFAWLLVQNRIWTEDRLGHSQCIAMAFSLDTPTRIWAATFATVILLPGTRSLSWLPVLRQNCVWAHNIVSYAIKKQRERGQEGRHHSAELVGVVAATHPDLRRRY